LNDPDNVIKNTYGSVTPPQTNQVSLNGFIVRGWIYEKMYINSNIRNMLGVPVANEWCGLRSRYGTTGCFQEFKNGYIYVTGAGLSFVLKVQQEWQKWNSNGRENSQLGLPKSSQQCASDNCKISFEGGTIIWNKYTNSTGTMLNSSEFNKQWYGNEAIRKRLAYPLGEEKLVHGVWEQKFMNGYMYLSKNTNGSNNFGYVDQRNRIGQRFLGLNALQRAEYGYPIGFEQCTPSVCIQNLQYAYIIWDGKQALIYFRNWGI
jgi:uncharacterized protein with LGFP repeats